VRCKCQRGRLHGADTKSRSAKSPPNALHVHSILAVMAKTVRWVGLCPAHVAPAVSLRLSRRSRSAAPGTFVTELSCTIRRAIQPRHCQSCRGRRRRSRERPHGRSALVAVPRSTHHSLTSARPDCTRQLRADRSTGTSRSRLRSAGGSATRRRGLGADEFPYCLVTTYESDLRKAAGAVLRLQAITEETSRSRLVKA